MLAGFCVSEVNDAVTLLVRSNRLPLGWRVERLKVDER